MKTILHFNTLSRNCGSSENGYVINYFHLISKIGAGFVLFFLVSLIPETLLGQAAASSNYTVQTGTLGTTYSWIDCSSGTSIVTGDDAQASISWPFSFSFYNNNYTTANSLSIVTNGFIRLDGIADTGYAVADSYNLSSTSTELGQIIATSVSDCRIGGIGSSWVKYLVTGSAPNRILTIEYNDIEIGYIDGRYADVQVSFYETSNKLVLKLGTDNIIKVGVEMGIHSGVSGYYDKWQDVDNGANNAWLEYTVTTVLPPQTAAASWNYVTQTGVLGTTYSWIDCSLGSSIVSGDDAQAKINWPFSFSYYDNNYTIGNTLSVATNGFIRLDGDASTSYSDANNYALTSTATNLGQIIAMALYDGNVTGTGWVRSIVSGTIPNRIFTIEYNNLEIDYNDSRYADVQVSFYESINKIVLKLGNENLNKDGVDMGIHSGVDGFFNFWKEVYSGTNNTWIEYTPSNVEVNASIGTSLAYYPTLKAAFDKINNGVHQGVITIKIKNNTTEPVSAVLNSSGTGGANYASVNMYPTVTGLSVSGNLTAPLIDLNGADNVTIDGRLNATGTTKGLTINNTSVSLTTGTSTIRFINDATNNTIKYCKLKGSETDANSGILFFSTSSLGNGNDNNTITNNNLTSSVTANRPVNVIYSLGTSGRGNSGNIISANNIYDFLKHATASNGILLSSNTSAWTIDGNSFYETASFAPTGSVTYNAIKINNISGNEFIVSNNYIGGNLALCEGTAWTKTNVANNIFTAINLNVGTTTASSVQNNTIRNFGWSNSSNATWSAIAITGGNVNVGTTTGNTIGAATGSGSVSVTGATTGQNVYGINITSTGTVDCQNNTIGSITAQNGATTASNIFGINKSSTAGNTTISNNYIGSASTGSSIISSSLSTSNAQVVNGISSSGTGIIVISNNSISNITNSATSSSTSQTYGIITAAGSNTIQNNTVYNISTASSQSGTGISASAIGIVQNSTTVATTQTLKGNVVYNINNTHPTAKVVVSGIYYAGPTAGTNTITGNFVHSLSISSSNTLSEFEGISLYDGLTTCLNNIISLGGDISTGYKINGIWDNSESTNNNNISFNSIYIGGTVSGATSNTAALYNAANTSTRNYRNNILVNTRSGGTTGTHYAVYLTGTTNLTIDYNDYYISGSNGVLAYLGSDQTTLSNLQTATSQDANSLSTNPNFVSGGGISSSDYITLISLPGISIPGITTDYDGVTREDPPKMGALELSLSFVWQGNTSTDFGIASNWENGAVPPNGADISFATTPANDCYLDQNRTIKDITNISAKKLVVNAKQLTITGNIISATANQINASAASSVVIFDGNAAQSIPTGVFVSNTIDALSLNNSYGLTQNGDLILTTAFTLISGVYTIGANTLTINGAVSTTSGSLTGGGSSNIIIGGSGVSTILPDVVLNNLSLNRANGATTGGTVSVAGTLSLTNGTLTLGAYTLAISGNSPTRISGNINASNASASVVFSNSTAITLLPSVFTGNINNLTINGAGITAGGDLSISGILNLQSANPSASKGSLDMSSYALSMGGVATSIGIGDVIGIVKREHAFTGNTPYSFGNEFTTVTFVNTGTKPSWLSCQIVLNAALPNKPGSVLRYYSFTEDAATYTDRVIVNLHYLDSELNGNTEAVLDFWDKEIDSFEEHGKTDNNEINNWVGLSGLGIGYFATSTNHPSSRLWGLGDASVTKNVWSGANSTEWNDVANWTGGTVPTTSSDVLISVTESTRYPSLTASSNAVAKTIEIALGASITANSYNLDISGSSGAWYNNGTFIPGTGTVNFSSGNIDSLVSISGSSAHSFYNLTVAANTYIQPGSGSIIQIGNTLTSGSGSILDFTATNNTIEFNGENQTVINPVGPGTDKGFHHLILSGSGIKTMPVSDLNIEGALSISGTASATAASSLTIGEALGIGNDATFATGNFDHTVDGTFNNDGTFTPSAGKAIILNGTSVQSIYGTSATSFEKLTINNPADVTAFANITVNDTLTLNSGKLNVENTLLTINGDVKKTSGFLNVTSQSSLAFGGTLALTLASNLFYTTLSIENLTINRTEGVIFGSDLTVNGVLNLQGANPSSGIIGSLSMGSNTLFMGATATTIGVGDVTGFVKRTTILVDTEYTFGNQFTAVSFPNIGTLPTEITVKISIGTAPSWKSDAVKRFYELTQVGASGTRAFVKGHYLDSELNGNDEQNLIDLTYVFPLTLLTERGRTDIQTDDNWVSLGNLDFGNVPAGFGIMELGFGVSSTDVITWDGSENTDWLEPTNWIPALVPDATKVIIIPDAAATPNDPILPASSTISIITIQTGGILNSGANSELTIVGSGGAWINNGTFNANTSKVIFNHGVSTNIVTIAGTTDFFNVEIGANTTIKTVSGCISRIAGAVTESGTSIVDFSSINNTVEWNGVNQTISNPNGLLGSDGYYNLILSGSGTKTMPTTAMKVNSDFTISGTASATAADSIFVLGNTTIGTGSTFATGSHHHFLSGNFENNGTFTPTTGGKISFNGTSAQTISGSSTTSFDGLYNENPNGLNLLIDIDVNNLLALLDGPLNVGSNTLGINGTISNLSGNIEVSSSSSLSFGGTNAITLNNNLFNANPIINNLSINQLGGVVLGNESITVNGTLALTSGTFTLGANTLTFSGSSPIRTSGTIDASNAASTLAFENATAITLPASVFSGNVNNMTINGIGGVIAGSDITMNAILYLKSANPSSTKGSLDMSSYTLDMGEYATTVGQGDVSGIIRRTTIIANTIYSFGNEFTTIYFPDVGILPAEMSAKVILGSPPSWKPGAVNRVYDVIQTGGSGTQALVQNHYLDSELNGNDENKLVELLHIFAGPLTIEYGRSDNNITENWVAISNINVSAYSSVFGDIEAGLDEFELVNLTWNGSTSTSWVTASNWTPLGAPSEETVVTIPDASTTNYDPFIPEIATCGKVIIESGGILSSISGGKLTVTGSGGAWINNGTFAPETGTVIFAHGDDTEAVYVDGTNNFYNITVADKTWFQPATNSVINIAGKFAANNSNCILDFGTNINSVTYNGSKAQNVISPGGSYAYYHLTFSGNGIKILHESSINILGNLSIDAEISTTGNTILMAGTSAQNIGSTTAITLNNLTIDNAIGVILNNTSLTTITGSLLINSGKKFEIPAAQKLSVTGAITNSAGSGGFRLNSDATGTASLIHDTNSVDATIERYISGAAEDWHFLSSPVSAQLISGDWLPSGTYGNGTGYDLYVWDESTPCWVYKLNTTVAPNWPTVHPSANFVAGKGYLYSIQAVNPTKEFAGSVNNGDQSIYLTNNSLVDSLKGFNLVGNAYPSSINWKASGWTRGNLLESGGGYDMWIWNPVANNYGVFNSEGLSGSGTNNVTEYIAPMQGFFVRAATAGNLVMTNSVRVHDGANNWKSAIVWDKFKIRIESNSENGYDEVLLQFGSSINQPGAVKLFSPEKSAPSIFIPYENMLLSVIYLTDTEENPLLPITFKPGSNGDYTFSVDNNMNDFDYLLLEDKKTSVFYNLKDNNSYRFNASITDGINRFVLHFEPISDEDKQELPAYIYSSDGNVVLDLTLVDEITDVKIVDVLGRTILQKSLAGNAIHSLRLNGRSQIFIVRAKTKNAFIVKKLFVN